MKSTSGSDTAIPSKAKIGSIRGHLVLLLVLFLAVQGVLFFSLQGRMQEINQRTYSYTLEKERLLDSQELFSLFLAWAKQTERAMGKSDFMNVAKCVRLLRELAVRTERLAKSPRLDPEMAQQISRVLSEEEALLFVADATMADLSNARDSFPAVEKQVRNAYAKIDQAISRLMSLEADKFKSSFDWSQRLRTEILVILAVAAVFDVLIILSSVSYGLQVARRISLLRAKAESFAGGEQITPTLDKDDDLSFLDKRLCEAADSINESESQRLEMIAVINHDLRTPLTAVLNGFELMSLGLLGDISKEDSEKLELCEKDLQRLLNQVNDLLMIEKIDAGAFEPIIQSVSLHEIFENVKQKSMAAMVGKQILLSVLSDEVLSKAVVKGDKNLLQKLYAIVLDNAVAATPAGGSITVSFAESETSLISQIRDQGSGIEPSLLTNIFDRCRFLNDKPVTGLGLPLASRICRLQAGNIKLEPQPKGGIAVEITIPKAS